MFTRFHGIDRHVAHLTIHVVDQAGVELKRIGRCTGEEIDRYLQSLTSDDVVLIEAGSGSFLFADTVERHGAAALIVDPAQFHADAKKKRRVKTDKKDAEKLSRALWKSAVFPDEPLPLVYKPRPEIRTLRRLFSALQRLNKALVMGKNAVVGTLRDIGIDLSETEKDRLFRRQQGLAALGAHSIDEVSGVAVESLLKVVYTCLEEKAKLHRQIIRCGAFLRSDVELLLSIKGVSPLLALAFLADVADLTRFRSTRALSAYLGLVPNVRSSGETERHGHIVRQSRALTRTLFTQAVQHIGASSPEIAQWYERLRYRRGVGRARIALIRKIVKIMRRMLLTREPYRHGDEGSTAKKLKLYHRMLKREDDDGERQKISA